VVGATGAPFKVLVGGVPEVELGAPFAVALVPDALGSDCPCPGVDVLCDGVDADCGVLTALVASSAPQPVSDALTATALATIKHHEPAWAAIV
jgi:hypothetical protein